MILSIEIQDGNESYNHHYFGVSDVEIDDEQVHFWYHNDVNTEKQPTVNGTVISVIDEGSMKTRDLVENILNYAIEGVTIGLSYNYPNTRSAVKKALSHIEEENNEDYDPNIELYPLDSIK